MTKDKKLKLGKVYEPDMWKDCRTISYLKNKNSDECHHLILPQWLGKLIQEEINRGFREGEESIINRFKHMMQIEE